MYITAFSGRNLKGYGKRRMLVPLAGMGYQGDRVSGMDIFFYEVFEEERTALERHLPAGIQAGFETGSIQESGHDRPPAGFISIRTQSLIPAEWAPFLSGILSRSTGFDHIKRYWDACSVRVPSGYLPLYCSRAVAEQALLLWLSLMRKLPAQRSQFIRFDRDGLTGMECEGKTLAVVGVGNIGSEVCGIGSALGMEVIGVDIVRKHPSIRYMERDEALAGADVIVCAMNLTGQNRGYFGYETLKKAKYGAVFVNIARGELSPAGDLLRLLEEGRLSGVGMDVYEDEGELAAVLRSGESPRDPVMKDVMELSRRSNAILTPHNAFNTREALERKAAQSAEQAEHFLRTGSFLWPVE
jgi:D-lactate dehydrogenase